MAQDWCGWPLHDILSSRHSCVLAHQTPYWSRKGSHSYLSGEVLVQACQDKSEPG